MNLHTSILSQCPRQCYLFISPFIDTNNFMLLFLPVNVFEILMSQSFLQYSLTSAGYWYFYKDVTPASYSNVIFDSECNCKAYIWNTTKSATYKEIKANTSCPWCGFPPKKPSHLLYEWELRGNISPISPWTDDLLVFILILKSLFLKHYTASYWTTYLQCL